MIAIRLAALVLCAGLTTLGAPMARAAPRCRKSCRQEAAGCATTRCSTLRGKARRDCLETCRGISGCAPIRTLAYVVAQCHTDAGGLEVGRQALEIRRGDCDPVTVVTIGTEPVPDPLGLCRVYGQVRVGPLSVAVGGFQRLGVSPDGKGVVFEKSGDVALLHLPLASPQQPGFFFVRADGSGLRWLGPASRDPCFQLEPNRASVIGFDTNVFPTLPFSPDGRCVVFTDLGPGPDGETVQIVTLDVASGRRNQVTHLPKPASSIPGFPATSLAGFLDNETIGFYSFANPEGLNPEGQLTPFAVKIDGTKLRALPPPIAQPGSQVIPRFAVTGGRARLATLTLDGQPMNHGVGPTGFFNSVISEVFLLSGRDLLQLTKFDRVDTFGLFVDPTRHRAFFAASADPVGSNPTQNCQLFSIDTSGEHLRQVTHFREGNDSLGCAATTPPGCFVSGGFFSAREDVRTGTIVFDSSCDPFGTNPYGDQLFAIRSDGSRLSTLTHTKGFVEYPDGSVTTELTGIWDYGPYGR